MIIKIEQDVHNISLQLGDVVYAVSAPVLEQGQQTSSGDIKKVGTVIGINGDEITIKDSSVNYIPLQDEFIMFSKDKNANNTSLIGYYAEVKLTNDSTKEAEIYSLSSEIAESSK